MRLYNRKAAIIAVLAASPGIFGATLTGRIYSDQGPPAANIPVTVQSTVAGPSGLTIYNAKTDTAGKFTLTVPSGASYSICADYPQMNLLDSCEWSLQGSIVVVPAQATSIQKIITLRSGVILRFRLSDPSGLVPSPATVAVKATANAGVSTTSASAAPSASTPAVQFGLFDSGGHYHDIRETSGDQLGHNFEILVPPAANFKLSVSGSNLQVTDSSGASLLGFTKSVSSSAASLGQTQVFTAAGPGPVSAAGIVGAP